MTYYRPQRELARYRDADGVSIFMTQQMLQEQVAAFADAFPDEDIVAVRLESEKATVISAYSRVPMPLAEEEPANEDRAPEDPDVQAVRRRDAGKALLIVALLALMLIGAVLGKVRGEVEPLPPGVLYVNPQPNGCVYETRRYDGVKWIVPRRNEAYLAGACVDARMAP